MEMGKKYFTNRKTEKELINSFIIGGDYYSC